MTTTNPVNPVSSIGRIRTLSLTILCQSTQSVILAGLPLLLPLIRKDMGLTFAQGGSLAAVSLLVYALMQIPIGVMADRFQPRKLVLIGTLGMMSLSLIMGFTEQYWQVLSIQILWGFFSSFILIPAMSMFINWLPQQRRATATVLPMLGIGIGVLVVNLVFPVIVNRFESWRIPFIVAGIAGIILALALLLFGKDPGHRYVSSRFQINLIWEIFRHKQVRICCGLQFIRFGIVQGIVYWLPSLLIDEKAFPLQLAGLVIASQSIFGAPSNIFGAYISDKYNKPNLIIGISLAILGITTGLMVVLDSVWLITAIVINAIFMQMYFGPLFAIAGKVVGPEKTGISNGVSNTFANFGGLASIFLMGILKDTTGSFEWGFYSICGIASIGLILTIILHKKYP